MTEFCRYSPGALVIFRLVQPQTPYSAKQTLKKKLVKPWLRWNDIQKCWQLVCEPIHRFCPVPCVAVAEGPWELNRSTSECFLLKQTSVQCFLTVSSPTGQIYSEKTCPSNGWDVICFIFSLSIDLNTFTSKNHFLILVLIISIKVQRQLKD